MLLFENNQSALSDLLINYVVCLHLYVVKIIHFSRDDVISKSCLNFWGSLSRLEIWFQGDVLTLLNSDSKI